MDDPSLYKSVKTESDCCFHITSYPSCNTNGSRNMTNAWSQFVISSWPITEILYWAYPYISTQSIYQSHDLKLYYPISHFILFLKGFISNLFGFDSCSWFSYHRPDELLKSQQILIDRYYWFLLIFINSQNIKTSTISFFSHWQRIVGNTNLIKKNEEDIY